MAANSMRLFIVVAFCWLHSVTAVVADSHQQEEMICYQVQDTGESGQSNNYAMSEMNNEGGENTDTSSNYNNNIQNSGNDMNAMMQSMQAMLYRYGNGGPGYMEMGNSASQGYSRRWGMNNMEAMMQMVGSMMGQNMPQYRTQGTSEGRYRPTGRQAQNKTKGRGEESAGGMKAGYVKGSNAGMNNVLQIMQMMKGMLGRNMGQGMGGMGQGMRGMGQGMGGMGSEMGDGGEESTDMEESMQGETEGMNMTDPNDKGGEPKAYMGGQKVPTNMSAPSNRTGYTGGPTAYMRRDPNDKGGEPKAYMGGQKVPTNMSAPSNRAGYKGGPKAYMQMRRRPYYRGGPKAYMQKGARSYYKGGQKAYMRQPYRRNRYDSYRQMPMQNNLMEMMQMIMMMKMMNSMGPGMGGMGPGMSGMGPGMSGMGPGMSGMGPGMGGMGPGMGGMGPGMGSMVQKMGGMGYSSMTGMMNSKGQGGYSSNRSQMRLQCRPATRSNPLITPTTPLTITPTTSPTTPTTPPTTVTSTQTPIQARAQFPEADKKMADDDFKFKVKRIIKEELSKVLKDMMTAMNESDRMIGQVFAQGVLSAISNFVVENVTTPSAAEPIADMVDPCSSNPCGANARCLSHRSGGFTCECSPGYIRTGQTCTHACNNSPYPALALNDRCLTFHTSDSSTAMTYVAAKAMCEARGGSMLTVKNVIEWVNVTHWLIRIRLHNFSHAHFEGPWLGTTRQPNNSNLWKYEGMAVGEGYTFWSVGEPMPPSSGKHCANINANNGKAYSQMCGRRITSCICQYNTPLNIMK